MKKKIKNMQELWAKYDKITELFDEVEQLACDKVQKLLDEVGQLTAENKKLKKTIDKLVPLFDVHTRACLQPEGIITVSDAGSESGYDVVIDATEDEDVKMGFKIGDEVSFTGMFHGLLKGSITNWDVERQKFEITTLPKGTLCYRAPGQLTKLPDRGENR